jgi:diacylglycerol kinase family enzyme
MRIALVINARAGSRDRAPAAIRDKIVAAGFEIVGEDDDAAPLPARIVAAAARPGIDALMVAGGDGTMACAASALAGGDTPLAILPLGTMNLLAKDLGLPLDLDEAVAIARDGATRRVDLGDVNGHVFLTSSIIGMPARMARYREAQRGGLDWRGIARFVGGLTRHLGRYPRVSVTARLDGGERRPWRFRMLAVVNNDFVERPGDILVREPLDGGALTVYVAPKLTISSMLRLAAGIAIGHWHRLPGLERASATSLDIETRKGALRVMNDGEVGLIEAPLRYTIRPKALAVIAPEIAR